MSIFSIFTPENAVRAATSVATTTVVYSAMDAAVGPLSGLGFAIVSIGSPIIGLGLTRLAERWIASVRNQNPLPQENIEVPSAPLPPAQLPRVTRMERPPSLPESNQERTSPIQTPAMRLTATTDRPITFRYISEQESMLFSLLDDISRERSVPLSLPTQREIVARVLELVDKKEADAIKNIVRVLANQIPSKSEITINEVYNIISKVVEDARAQSCNLMEIFAEDEFFLSSFRQHNFFGVNPKNDILTFLLQIEPEKRNQIVKEAHVLVSGISKDRINEATRGYPPIFIVGLLKWLNQAAPEHRKTICSYMRALKRIPGAMSNTQHCNILRSCMYLSLHELQTRWNRASSQYALECTNLLAREKRARFVALFNTPIDQALPPLPFLEHTGGSEAQYFSGPVGA